MQVRKMRNIRLRHRISIAELGRACGLSPQRIGEIEFGKAELSLETQRKLYSGFRLVADSRERSLEQLREDISHFGPQLFEHEEEEHSDL